MKMARFIQLDPASESTLAREWKGIERRTRRPARRRIAGAALVTVGLGAAVALVFVLQRPQGLAASALEGAVFGSDTGWAAVDLRDGSHIEVEPRARVAVVRGDPRAVRIEVRGGAALFEVSHVEKRSFVVEAAGVDISVVGTRFRVNVDASRRVRVAVERGMVELRRRGQTETVQRLGAGEESTLVTDGASPP